jgi:hypothetical protein
MQVVIAKAAVVQLVGKTRLTASIKARKNRQKKVDNKADVNHQQIKPKLKQVEQRTP